MCKDAYVSVYASWKKNTILLLVSILSPLGPRFQGITNNVGHILAVHMQSTINPKVGIEPEIFVKTGYRLKKMLEGKPVILLSYIDLVTMIISQFHNVFNRNACGNYACMT